MFQSMYSKHRANRARKPIPMRKIHHLPRVINTKIIHKTVFSDTQQQKSLPQPAFSIVDAPKYRPQSTQSHQTRQNAPTIAPFPTRLFYHPPPPTRSQTPSRASCAILRTSTHDNNSQHTQLRLLSPRKYTACDWKIDTRHPPPPSSRVLLRRYLHIPAGIPLVLTKYNFFFISDCI